MLSLNFSLFSQDTIKFNKNHLKFSVYKGIDGIKLFEVEGITKNLTDTLKTHRNFIKNLSQNDSVLVFAGVLYSEPYKFIEIGDKKIKMPRYCYKVVISLSTHKLIQCLVFTNTDEPTQSEWKLYDLEGKTRFYFDRLTGFPIK